MQVEMNALIEAVISDSVNNLKKEISDNVLLTEVSYLYTKKAYNQEAEQVRQSVNNFAVIVDKILNNYEGDLKQSIKEHINNLPTNEGNIISPK